MYILSAICSDYALASVLGIIKRIITILQIVVPIFLIIGGSITFSKALINPDDGPKAKKNFLNAIASAVIVFLMPFLINSIMAIISAYGDVGITDSNGNNTAFNISSCWSNANVTDISSSSISNYNENTSISDEANGNMRTNSNSQNNNRNNSNNSNKNNNSNNSNNSNKNNNSSSSKSDSSKYDDSNSKSLKIGGKTFNVGDTIVCTYNLTTPAVLENYQATIKYDSSKLTCKSAKMSEPAKYGAMLNIKIAGEISLSGVNIGDGYDYTNGGAFMTVVYEVKGGGSTSPSYHWEVACRASDSKNLIDKKGKPASGFKLSSSYKD